MSKNEMISKIEAIRELEDLIEERNYFLYAPGRPKVLPGALFCS